MPVVIVATASGVSHGELVRRTRFFLEDYPLVGHLTAATGPSDPTISVSETGSWAQGSRLEFDDDTFEQAHVGGKVSLTLTDLDRGMWGTTGVAHVSGCRLLKEPRFPGQMIFDTLTRIVESELRGELWVDTLATATPVANDPIYEMPDDFIGWKRITQMTTSSVASSQSYGVKGSGYGVKILYGVDDSLSTSGIALSIPAANNVTNPLQITYGAQITIDNVPDGAAANAAVLGAVSQLIALKDVPRTGKDVTLGGSSVQPGATLRTAAWFKQEALAAKRKARLELLRTGSLKS